MKKIKKLKFYLIINFASLFILLFLSNLFYLDGRMFWVYASLVCFGYTFWVTYTNIVKFKKLRKENGIV